MRNRYVKKCKCAAPPAVTKKTGTLSKGVLDIEVTVSCTKCQRPYREVGPKRTKIEHPEILVEVPKTLTTPFESEDTGEDDELNGTGNGEQETESTEDLGPEEEPPVIETEEKEEIEEELEDSGRDLDEGVQEDKIEESPEPKKNDAPGEKAGNKPIDPALSDKPPALDMF